MKRGALPLNALRAFEATMRHGQMRLAADELGVTHGAVSRQVRLLEEILEVPLFEGPRNKLVPTQTALELEPALTEAFDGIEVAVARAMQSESRFLDVSCTGTLAMRWLIPRLVDFQTAHPKIEVRLTGEYGPVDFSRHRFDVAIRVGRGPWGDAEVTELFAEAAGPVVSPKCAASVDLDAPETLHALPALHTKTRPAAWADWCREMDLAPPAGGRVFEHFYFLLEAATAGLGVAIAPEVLVRDDVAAGRLLAPFGFAPTGQAYVALRPRRPNRDAQLFIAWLEDAAVAPDPAS
ncbi:DNA-binding transcriptional LysR family regulator [Rhodopseudomonas julia]|uniref:DNA-binding transcriptional LysR family regulator n=1 Tax=Rhodopseudomonas julia TaxID=200617 RepID=A0ABU0C3J2_9BRAD|nr:LysR family transcriptional regulator [Rhodopseudomonas julia]MDQ0324534.1 DNA-binding transcriptional LysR family regulator [Rhodopseudomonas julia]